jgi:hypothetical protein
MFIGRVVATGGAVVAAIGTFLPWLRSGTRRRNSFEIFSLVDRLGFSPSGPVGWAIRMWPTVVLLLAAAVTALWFPLRWVTPSVAGIAVLYAGAVSIAVRSAPATSLVSVQSGPVVTLVGTIILLAGALLTAIGHGTPAPREGSPDDRS